MWRHLIHFQLPLWRHFFVFTFLWRHFASLLFLLVTSCSLHSIYQFDIIYFALICQLFSRSPLFKYSIFFYLWRSKKPRFEAYQYSPIFKRGFICNKISCLKLLHWNNRRHRCHHETSLFEGKMSCCRKRAKKVI